MRFVCLILFFFAAAVLPTAGEASVVLTARAHTPEIVLHLKPPMVTGSAVSLPYQIPFPGYIEFYLFDAEKKKIWQNFGVKEKGDHAQSLKAEKFEKGKTYHYEFWYKGKAYPGKFTF